MPRLRDLHDKVWQALTARNLDGAGSYVARNCRFMLPGVSVRGFDRVRPYFDAYLQGFPNTRAKVRSSLEDRDNLVVRSTVTGKQSGAMPTTAGEVRPTGRLVEWEIAEWLTVRDGKISEWRIYQDPTPFMQALNVVQAGAAAGRPRASRRGRGVQRLPAARQKCVATMVTV